MVFEGFFLVKRADGKVGMIWQRSNPIRPTELAERSSIDYEDIDQGVSLFIENEWSHGIDGIRVIPETRSRTSN